MFVSQRKYDELRVRHSRLILSNNRAVDAYNKLLDEWNELVGKLNAKGGESFINSNRSATELTNEDVKKLLLLCHPDKHNGKKLATEMTAFLNELNRK